jgi:hypothetical protein
MMERLFYDLQAILILLFSLFIAISTTIGIFSGRTAGYPMWLVVFLSITAYFYSIIYAIIIFTDPVFYETRWFRDTLVRPANLLFVGVVACFVGYHIEKYRRKYERLD